GGGGGGGEEGALGDVERILDLNVEPPAGGGESKSAEPGAFEPGLTSVAAFVPELRGYFNSSFGHPVRLDYGTGHESSFMVLLLSLLSLGICGPKLQVEDITNAHKPLLSSYVYSAFQSYLLVTRSIQTAYNLEPAGSHGVWGLDDYHCLPFYFGACELEGLARSGLCDPSLLLPRCVRDSLTLRDFGDDLMYVGCIRFVRELKEKAAFAEGSPMLYDISELPGWPKASKGLERLLAVRWKSMRSVSASDSLERRERCSRRVEHSRVLEARRERARRSSDWREDTPCSSAR
ncbi:hypothetical protein TrRE_jg4084, partial [Triparma retinervis]